MRNKVLLLALTSILMSLCVPACAQQAYVKPKVLAQYVIKIGDISEETMARPKGRTDYFQNVYELPAGITFKELIFSLPGLTKDESGRLITMEGRKIVRRIYFNQQPVSTKDFSLSNFTNDTKLEMGSFFRDSPCRLYKDDTKLNSGTVFVKMEESTDRKQDIEIEIEYFQKVSYDMVGGNSEFVDLGLGVKWATRNVGAAGPEEIGGFYSWAETEPDHYYDYTKYNGKSVLEMEDDVAHVKLGGNWRLPTAKEINKLIKKCTWSWASVNGEIGFLITSNKLGYRDRSIFLPYYYGGTSGDVAYWSGSFDASPDGGCTSLWICFDGNINTGYCYRNWQLPVRPVCK